LLFAFVVSAQKVAFIPRVIHLSPLLFNSTPPYLAVKTAINIFARKNDAQKTLILLHFLHSTKKQPAFYQQVMNKTDARRYY